MNKLILITVLALAGMNNARSNLVDLSFVGWSYGSARTGTAFAQSDWPDAKPTNPLVATVANQGVAASYSSWNFSNTPEQAVWSGEQFFLGLPGIAASGAEMWLMINEPVSYSLSGGLFGSAVSGGMFTQIERAFDPVTLNEYRVESVGSLLNGTFSAQGFLRPGTHILTFGSSLTDGVGFGNFAFTFNSVPVPEGGSTMMLLGLALGVIGILRLPKALA